MHAKPDLRVFLKWMIARSGSVITDVITLRVLIFNHGLECRMNPAAKTGHIRMAAAFASFASLFPVLWLFTWAKDRWPEFETLFFILFAIFIMAAMVLFYTAMCRWRTRCPKCSDGTARFTHEKYVEYLTCNTCDYSEKTGYTLGD